MYYLRRSDLLLIHSGRYELIIIYINYFLLLSLVAKLSWKGQFILILSVSSPSRETRMEAIKNNRAYACAVANPGRINIGRIPNFVRVEE